MRLTSEKLKTIFRTLSRAKCALYAPLLRDATLEFGINSRKRACAFLAQIGHESADLKYMQEIASGAAYEGRRDLGNIYPGDGRKFKGRGPLQITGRDNYRKAGDALQLDLIGQPELLEDPRHGFRASAWWWKAHGLNQKADALTLTGNARDLAKFDVTTRTINGGYNGRVDRQRRYLDCINVLTDEDFAAPTGPLPGDQVVTVNSRNNIPRNIPRTDRSPKHTQQKGNLLDKLANSPIRRTIGSKIGNRIGTPLTTLFMALQAGNIYAWLGVAVLVIGLAAFIYIERRTIACWVQQLRDKL